MKDLLFGLDDVAPHDEGWELLTTAHDNMEIMVLRSILDGAKIPYMIKERGSGSATKIITGSSVFGSDIFVPAQTLDAAKDLIDEENETSEEDIEEFLANVAPHDEGWSYLTSAHDDEELAALFKMLDSGDIQYQAIDREGKKLEGITEFFSLEGIDVFVPDEQLDAAVAIVAPEE